MYGIAIKYTIPSLTASAFTPPSSLSRAARHIAHWAFEAIEKREKTIVKTTICKLLNLVCIIRRNH